MAPKKKQEKMSLGTFLQDEKLGSWADEMEDMPVYSRTTGYGGGEKRTYSSQTGTYGSGNVGGYSVREELPLPDKPPYTTHLGNLSFDATIGDVQDFFTGCDCVSVRIIEDKMDMKPKGFGYATFETREGLIKALALSGEQFQGRNIRISVADPPKDNGRPDIREIGDWSRKGPLPDLPNSRGNDRRGSDRGFGSEMGGERRERFQADEGRSRDFGNWERKGPLSPLPQQERQNSSREGDRPGTHDGPRGDGFRDRRASPAAWGEGRPQDGAPRREFQERPVVERAPTAAEQDSQWRSKMRPDAPPATSSAPSRDGSEAPGSPAAAPALASRPKLNLAKRTVSEAPTPDSPASTTGDAKASPFGAARPIDTAAREKELEEKRLAAIEEKKKADEKAKEERRIAKEAADAEKAKQAESGENKVEILQREDEKPNDTETIETENANGNIVDDKATKPREIVRDARPKPSDTGAWRRPSGGPPKAPRGENVRGQRGDGDHVRGQRGDGPRGPRQDRGPRANGGQAPPAAAPASSPAPAQAAPVDSETAALEEEGWSTVAKPKKNQRGGGQRVIAS